MTIKNHRQSIPKTDYFNVNERNHLVFSGCDTVSLAKEFGTPLYVMSEDGIREKCKIVKENFMDKFPGSLALYASKAFSTVAVYKILKEEGVGVDVVSGGELYAAHKADFPMDKIYFHGNNKSEAEIQMAIEFGVRRFVVDSYYELDQLDELSKANNIKMPILLRISPGIDIHGHDAVKTGVLDCKFGFPIETGFAHEACVKASSYENLEFVGVHCHIGSQIFTAYSFGDAVNNMMGLVKDLKEKHGIVCSELNMGGGYGVRYTDDSEFLPVTEVFETMMNAVSKFCKDNDVSVPKVLIEPGRWMVGESGITLYTVGAEKHIEGVRTYVSVDGGMADNPRPSLYDAKYQAIVANNVNADETTLVTIAGRCCESGDLLIKDIMLPKLKPNDTLAFLTTGAYTYSMSSHYNKLPNAAVVMIKNGVPRIIVKRETYDDLIKNDVY